MATTPKPAKICSPRTLGVYPRARLYAELDKARQQPVIWLAAPPGSGKTTLIASYLAQSKLPYLWIQVDAGDVDAATFYHYLGKAVQLLAPRSKKILPELTSEYSQGLMTFSRNYFRDLFLKSKAPCIIVIDNYQDLPHDSLLHQMLAAGFEEIPDDCNVFVISRIAPPQVYSKLLANRVIYLIPEQRLRLDMDEAIGLAQAGEYSIDTMQLQNLYQHVDGWAAGLILLLQQKQLNPDFEPSTDRTPDILFHYFINEVFSLNSQTTQEFLIKTSIIPNIPVSVAERLTGQDKSHEILQTLEHKHFFTQRLDHQQQVYRYHPLFREFLQSRLSDYYTPIALKQIKAHAAKLLQEHEFYEDAITLYLHAQDWGSAINLLQQYSKDILNQGRHRTLLEQLSQIPEQLALAHPEVAYWQGMAYLQVDPPTARQHFESAWREFKKTNDETYILLAWCGIVNAIVLTRNTYGELDDWYAWFIERYDINSIFPSIEVKAHVATSLIGIFAYRIPQSDNFRTWAETAFNASQEIDNQHLILQSQIYTMVLYSFRGEFTEVQRISRSLKNLFLEEETAPMLFLVLKWLESSFQWQLGKAKRGLDMIGQGLSRCAHYGLRYWDHQFYAYAVYSSLALGLHGEAKTYLSKMRESTDFSRPHIASHYHLLVGSLALQENDMRTALEEAKLTRALSIKSESTFPIIVAHLALINALIANRDYQSAKQELSDFKQSLTIFPTYLGEFGYLLASSWLALEQKNEDELTKRLPQLFEFSKHHQLTSSFFPNPLTLTKVCQAALQRHIEPARVKEVITAQQLIPDITDSYIEDWPWKIKLYTLGRHALFIDEQEQTLGGKSAQRPLTLLHCLIAFGGSKVSQEKVMLTLWPDAQGDKANGNLRTTLHRLRRLLQHDEALVVEDGRLTLDKRYIWVDVWTLERHLSSLDKLLTNGNFDNVEVSRHCDAMSSLYQGPFLGLEAEQSWLLPLQEKMRNRLLNTFTRLGNAWQNNQDLEQAISCYLKAIEIDPLMESFYQNLMQLYAANNQRTEALATFQRCRKALATTLGTTPSSHMVSLYKQIEVS